MNPLRPTRAHPERLEDRSVPALVANGFLAEYYDTINLTGPAVLRQDPTVNFNWGTGSPDSRIAADTFSARWTGQIEPRFSQTYTFETRSDDGIRLWIDGVPVINQWNDHAPTTHTGQIALQAGRRYDIRLEYYENGGGAVAQLFWASPSQPREVVPQSRTYSSVNGTSQYILTSGVMTWANAQAQARALGGDLVTVNSSAEETWLKTRFGTVEAYWTGLNDEAVEGQFRWASGQAVSYTNWAAGEPNNYNGAEDYGGMNYGTARQWNDYTGGTLLRGLIELPADFRPGVVALATSVIEVSEAAGSARVTVRRTDGTDGTVTVDYRTVAASATAGVDYTTTTGTVTFLPGEAEKTVVVPVFNDTLTESAEAFNFNIDNVTGGATLLVPRTATVTILDDESPVQRLFTYGSFIDTSGLSLNGSSTLTAGALRLTPAAGGQAGSAFRRAPLEVNANTSFQTRFSFLITGAGRGDGLTFAMHNVAAGASAVGGAGGALGFAGVWYSVAVEFDTFQNSFDANPNHVSVLHDGDVSTPLATTASPVALLGSRVYAWVDYDGATNGLSVFVATSATKPSSALLTRNVDLAAEVGTKAYLGFTAGSGANAHDVIDWEFSSNSRLLPPADTGPISVTAQTVASGFVQPTAADWSGDGRNLYVAEQRGTVRVIRDGALLPNFVLDFRDRINGTRDRGLLDVTAHPSFAANPYLYLLYTYDPPEVYQNASHPLAGPDRNGNRAGRLTRVTLDAATNYTTIVANSEVVLVGRNSTWANFNAFVNSTTDFTAAPGGIRADGTNVPDFIATDSESHTVGAAEFGADGLLYVTIGDGTSYNRVDPRTVRVMDVNNLSGKVLRIDPITGAGLASNPFYNGDVNSNRSKVYQLGVRNAFRLGIDKATNRVYLGDVGWNNWEEINTGPAGANFGWPYYEGGSGGTSQRTGGYQDLAAAQAFYAAGTPVTAPLYALNHAADGINAIVMGDVYRGAAYSTRYDGNLFFNDLGQGIVRTAKLDAAGRVERVEVFATGAQVVVQIKQGPDGLLYFVDLDDGRVGRWVPA